MARPRALTNEQIFSLAEQLRTAGQVPSVTKVAEQAKAEFGVTPSYTTLKQVLADWRQLDAANVPKELPPEFVNGVLSVLTHLYGRLTAQARSEFEPRCQQAEREREVAELARDRLEVERTRLADEVAYLRHQVNELTERNRTLAAAHAEGAARAAALETAKGAAVARAEDLARELTSARAALEAAEVTRREQAARWQAEREQLLARHADEINGVRDEHASMLAQRQEEHARALAEKHAELKRRDALLAGERETVQDLRGTIAELQARMNATSEALLDARRTLERQTAELVSITAARDQIAEDLRHVHDQYKEERKEHRARIQMLEAQINTLVESRSVLDQRYESLLDILSKDQHAKAAE